MGLRTLFENQGAAPQRHPQKDMQMFNTKIKAVEQSLSAQLRQYIASPPEGSIKMLVTPEMAIEMLAYNNRNRPVSASVVGRYASEMLDGRWRYTRVPVIFSDQGRLIDGQHRLYACVESEVSFTTDVVFGADDDSFDVIDVGKKRNAADIFGINGVKYAKDMAAISRVLWKYDNGRVSLVGGISSMNAGVSHGDLYEYFLTLEGVEGTIPVINSFKSSRLASPAIMGALHYVCSRKCKRDADAFFQIVSEGGGKAGSPAQEVHKRLIRNATSVDKMNVDYLAKLVILAWNRERAGLSARGLRIQDGKIPAAR